MQGITKSGFKFEIDDRILKDWRFVSALTKCQQSKTEFGKLEGIMEMASLLFGDRYDEYLKHIASKNDGFCDSQAIMEEIKEILESAKVKN